MALGFELSALGYEDGADIVDACQEVIALDVGGRALREGATTPFLAGMRDAYVLHLAALVEDSTLLPHEADLLRTGFEDLLRMLP
jgi:hypothetical protein